jgi:hypothetical protein
LKCWGCGEEHLLRDFPYRKQNNRRVYNIQEVTTVNDVARSMPQIYATLDNRQLTTKPSVVEVEGMISNHLVSILIDPGSNLSYVSPKTIEKCKLQQVKHVKSWLVQLATGTKRKVTEVIPACQFIMNGLPTQANPKHALLSLKFRLHMATRTPHHLHIATRTLHHQNSNEVIHGTELNSQHSRRVRNYAK